jgi:hypothetical protein
MQDARFTAQLKAAKFVARNEDDKTIRRVQFSLARDFSLDIADWLGAVATNQRDLLVKGDIDSVEIPIDAYHAKAMLSGLGGNAEMQVDGVCATAVVKAVGKDEGQREEVTFVFEAYPHAPLLTFLAAALKEHIDCEFKRSQLTIAQTMQDPKERVKQAAKDLAATVPKGEQMTITAKIGGKTTRSAKLDGTGEKRA